MADGCDAFREAGKLTGLYESIQSSAKFVIISLYLKFSLCSFIFSGFAFSRSPFSPKKAVLLLLFVPFHVLSGAILQHPCTIIMVLETSSIGLQIVVWV